MHSLCFIQPRPVLSTLSGCRVWWFLLKCLCRPHRVVEEWNRNELGPLQTPTPNLLSVPWYGYGTLGRLMCCHGDGFTADTLGHIDLTWVCACSLPMRAHRPGAWRTSVHLSLQEQKPLYILFFLLLIPIYSLFNHQLVLSRRPPPLRWGVLHVAAPRQRPTECKSLV